MQDKKYYVNADIIRIFAGISVVFIHVAAPFLSYPPYFGIGGFPFLILSLLDAVSRVSVPLFIMLSGYLLLRPEKKMVFKDFYIRRLSKIGIPFIFWLIIYFFTMAHSGIHLSLLRIVTLILSSNVGVLYFLIVIIELYAITPAIIVFLQNTDKKSHLVAFISVTLFIVVLEIINATIPRARVITDNNILTIFIPYIPYYLGGYMLKNIALSSTKKIILAFIYWLVLLFILLSTDTTADVVTAVTRQPESITVLLMTFLLFILLIDWQFLKKKLSSKTSSNIIKFLASSIFGIYLIHIYVLATFDNYTHLLPGSIQQSILVIVIMKVFVVFLVSFGIVAILRKIPFIRLLLGF